MKTLFLLFIFFFSFTEIIAQRNYINNESKLPSHPRLILLENEEAILRKNIGADTTWLKINDYLLIESDNIINLPVLERNQIGRRILFTSRECLRRVYFLSYAWRMTGDVKYANRAEKELLNVCGFIDWNPTHFLDVAEMTMAVAIGYDWLFPVLSDFTKEILSASIVSKGLEQSYHSYGGWIKGINNWNQICNAGMVYGALAVFEKYPVISSNVINRAIESVKIPMKEYAPDGVYPEGYSYWEFGTGFNVLLIDALDKSFGTDYGLSEASGFIQSAFYQLNMLAPSKLCFNYSDCDDQGLVNYPLFWFSKKTNNLTLLWNVKEMLEQDKLKLYLHDRFLPNILIWGSNINLDKIPKPTSLCWHGNGKGQVSIMRTSWIDPNAIFIGFKGGTPKASHGHMDVGSFVMEANGVRWALDFGREIYNTIENKGIDLWNMKQNGDRWNLLRYNNLSHNTLTINNSHQLVDSQSQMIHNTKQPMFMSSVIDLSPVYAGDLQSAQRGIAIVDKSYVLIRDEVTSKDKPITLRWNMLTDSNVKIINDYTVELTKNGKKLTLKAQSNAKLRAKTWSAQPLTDYEAKNPGKKFVGFELQVPVNSKSNLVVLLLPEGKKEKKPVLTKTLNNWK